MGKREPKSWSDVWEHHVSNGQPYEEAAYRADQWEKKRKEQFAAARQTCSCCGSSWHARLECPFVKL
jgi:hypothetical protein